MPYASFAIPANGLCCPSGGISFSFVSERKRNQKEREFKGCALKNPLIVQSFCAQSRTLCLPSPQLQVTLRRASSCFVALRRALSRAARGNLYEAEKRRVCTNITSSAPKPSALDRRSQCNLNRRSQCCEGKGTRSAESPTSLCDVGEVLPAAKYSRAPMPKAWRMRNSKFG